MSRVNGRRADQLRAVTLTRHVNAHAEGSCLIECGSTRVLCTASVEERVPSWMRDQNRGWVTAEYGMLPRATHDRTPRESAQGKQGGRTLEIQRLIGRSLRSVVNLEMLGKRTIWIDCDVLQADGGTRTASITGGFVALMDACSWLKEKGRIKSLPINEFLAAISCGLVDGVPLLDLDYSEDSRCGADMNFVMNGAGRFVEVQGTAEGYPFSRSEFTNLAGMAETGIGQLIAIQRRVLLQAVTG
ncbi:ribonuclease PH [Candidatus Magnetaquicoccus inordinatus]|uniref:ribonuclease PH n=1 Tax=Candidatus Magnetaquicoccus inordinatus TaxID=2496818 RepID=UPI00102B8DA1|nr:ribonuclease PH [Candidatus Magnetaquicoccus inordinatus]